MTYARDERGRPSSRALWFGLLSGPVVWSILFLLLYMLIEIACRAGILRANVLGLELASIVVLVLSLVSLLVIAYAAIISYRNFRQAGGQSLFQRSNLGLSPARFMAASGLLLNLLFSVLIILMALPAIFLSPCVR